MQKGKAPINSGGRPVVRPIEVIFFPKRNAISAVALAGGVKHAQPLPKGAVELQASSHGLGSGVAEPPDGVEWVIPGPPAQSAREKGEVEARQAGRPSGVGVERRAHERLPVAMTAHCRIGPRHLRARVTDISVGGLLLKTEEMAPVGAQVRLAVNIPQPSGVRVCVLAGEVARLEVDRFGNQRGLGVRLSATSIAPVDRASLGEFVRMRGYPLALAS